MNSIEGSKRFMERILRTGLGVQRVDFVSYTLFLAPVPYVDEGAFGAAQVSPDTLGLWEKQDVAWVPAEKVAWSMHTGTCMHHKQRRRMVLHYRLSRLMACVDYVALFASLVPASAAPRLLRSMPECTVALPAGLIARTPNAIAAVPLQDAEPVLPLRSVLAAFSSRLANGSVDAAVTMTLCVCLLMLT